MHKEVTIPAIEQKMKGEDSETAENTAKKRSMENGVRIMTFHGTLGKIVMFGGAVNMLLAILFWGWSPLQKIRLIALLAVTLIFATVLPLPQEFTKSIGLPECFEMKSSSSEWDSRIPFISSPSRTCSLWILSNNIAQYY